MKRLFVFALALTSVVFPMTSSAQAGVEKKVLATLGPGETLAYGEDCFLLDRSPESVSFVTIVRNGNEKQYYCYGKDGKKTGPVQKPDPAYWSGRESNKKDDCQMIRAENATAPEKYINYDDGSVNFNGQKFGPYGQIFMFSMPEGEKSFFALALTEEMKMVFFDSFGRKVDVMGTPDNILVSPDGKMGYIKMQGSYNPFDPESVEKMMENPEELNDPKINLYGIDGSKYGPYPFSSFRDWWYTPAGQFVVYVGNEVFINGKPAFKPESGVYACDIWISADGSDYVYGNYEKLTFKDGAVFTAPIAIEYTAAGSKGTLKWLSLENGKELVLYKKNF